MSKVNYIILLLTIINTVFESGSVDKKWSKKLLSIITMESGGCFQVKVSENPNPYALRQINLNEDPKLQKQINPNEDPKLPKQINSNEDPKLQKQNSNSSEIVVATKEQQLSVKAKKPSPYALTHPKPRIMYKGSTSKSVSDQPKSENNTSKSISDDESESASSSKSPSKPSSEDKIETRKLPYVWKELSDLRDSLDRMENNLEAQIKNLDNKPAKTYFYKKCERFVTFMQNNIFYPPAEDCADHVLACYCCLTVGIGHFLKFKKKETSLLPLLINTEELNMVRAYKQFTINKRREDTKRDREQLEKLKKGSVDRETQNSEKIVRKLEKPLRIFN